MSSNLKTKKEKLDGGRSCCHFWGGKKESGISLRLHLYIATRVLLKGHVYLQLQVAKKRKAIESWTVGCISYVVCVVLCGSGQWSPANPIYSPD